MSAATAAVMRQIWEQQIERIQQDLLQSSIFYHLANGDPIEWQPVDPDLAVAEGL